METLSNNITLGLLVYDWFAAQEIKEYFTNTSFHHNMHSILCRCHFSNSRVLAVILNDESKVTLFPMPWPSNHEELKTRVHISAADPEFFGKLLVELKKTHIERYGTEAERPD